MSQVIFGILNVIGREKPLLLEDTIKNLVSYADLQDFKFDDKYTPSASGWVTGAGVTIAATGSGGGVGGVAVFDDGVSTYDGGFVYG